MCKLLRTINGGGAQAALSLLSFSRIHNLKYAIMLGDEKHLCKAPGVGKKTAGRIILELKDKIKKEDMAEGISNLDNKDNVISIDANIIAEALGALLALGYSEKEAESALKKVNKEDTLENIIKNCLKVLMG